MDPDPKSVLYEIMDPDPRSVTVRNNGSVLRISLNSRNFLFLVCFNEKRKIHDLDTFLLPGIRGPNSKDTTLVVHALDYCMPIA